MSGYKLTKCRKEKSNNDKTPDFHICIVILFLLLTGSASTQDGKASLDDLLAETEGLAREH